MKKYSWGVPALDNLTGGITSVLNLIYGETASGKTTLSSYWSICRIWKETVEKLGKFPENGKFIIIDGDLGYDEERAFQIWEENGLDPDEVNEHVYYKSVREFADQHKIIVGDKGKGSIDELVQKNDWIPMLISFDPITAIAKQKIQQAPAQAKGVEIQEYYGKIALQLHHLRRMSIDYDCPVFVTSWVASPMGEAMREFQIAKLVEKYNITREEAEKMVPKPEKEIIGPREIKYLPKVILKLEIPKEGRPERRAILMKHRGKPSGGTAMFRLCDKGIEPVEEKT